ncbi:MAG: hypothetical protein VR65_15390 [Desulfobulbaceae bacterium BRH_c16a]|nr:MAG: hypothetical protein VR65_15390 [Desulfobulbaceae bacterium BRH_c16a]
MIGSPSRYMPKKKTKNMSICLAIISYIFLTFIDSMVFLCKNPLFRENHNPVVISLKPEY